MKADDFFELLHSPARAAHVALRSMNRACTYEELDAQLTELADLLQAAGLGLVASYLDNGINWIITDLACLRAGIVHIPLPQFFTSEQLRASIELAGADAIIVATDAAATPWESMGFARKFELSTQTALYVRATQRMSLHKGTAKITFTSGSTGTPKGVCLDAESMLAVASGVAQAMQSQRIERHLNVLPLPVLLENVAGVYAPLMAGMTIAAMPLAMVGIQRSSSFSPQLLAWAIELSGAQSLILLPQMLRAYTSYLAMAQQRAPSTLKFVAVGGAPVGAHLIAQARALGVPAYEGYGISEGSSVQTLALPGADSPGSVGAALPHARLRIAPDGEVEIAGSLFLGYLGQAPRLGKWLATGDLGHFDASGCLYIDGRKKNVLITSFGRNVSPEWIETELCGETAILHAVVLGNNQPLLGAVIWPMENSDDAAIQKAIDRVNECLPDYARVGPWLRAVAEFSAASGMATANGRPRRDAVAAGHAGLFAATPPSTSALLA